MGFKEAITYFGALDHATECRVDAETVALRAYVTGGRPVPTRDAHACALRPHATSRGELVARTRAARRSRAARAAGGRQSQGCGSGEGRRRLRCSEGAVAAEVPTLKAADDAKVPAMPTGTRVKSARTDSRAASATLRLHRTYRSSVWRRDRYVASDAVASTTGATDSIARSSRRTRRSRLGRAPGHPAAGCLRAGSSMRTRPYVAAVTTATIAPTVLGDGPYCTYSVLRRPIL